MVASFPTKLCGQMHKNWRIVFFVSVLEGTDVAGKPTTIFSKAPAAGRDLLVAPAFRASPP